MSQKEKILGSGEFKRNCRSALIISTAHFKLLCNQEDSIQIQIHKRKYTKVYINTEKTKNYTNTVPSLFTTHILKAPYNQGDPMQIATGKQFHYHATAFIA